MFYFMSEMSEIHGTNLMRLILFMSETSEMYCTVLLLEVAFDTDLWMFK